jgi:hypothetical protein
MTVVEFSGPDYAAYKNTNRFNIYEPLFNPKRLFWIGMALKSKVFIKHMNFLE